MTETFIYYCGQHNNCKSQSGSEFKMVIIMATTFWELYNYKYINDDELEKTDFSSYDNDCEILIEVDGDLYECNIGDLTENDGKLVLEVRL